MKNFVTIKLFKTFDKVAYYTFWIEGQHQTETDAFFTRFEHDQSLIEDMNLLVAWITEIGQHRGAKAHYFRFENDANALPPPARIMAELGDDYCRLRLYCLRLTEQVVILANGGLKTGRTVQDSPELVTKFRFANKMAGQVIALIQANELIIRGKEIIDVELIDLIH